MTSIPDTLAHIRDHLNGLAASHRTFHPDDLGFELRRLACITDATIERAQVRPVLSTRELEHAGVTVLHRAAPIPLGGDAA